MGKRAGGRRRGGTSLRVVGGGASRGTRKAAPAGPALTPLITDLRRRLRDPDPWNLLGFLSTVVQVSDGRLGPDDTPMQIDPLVESFIDIDVAETTAALHVLAVLLEDEELRTRTSEELAHRKQRMPLWLSGLAEAKVTRAAMMAAENDRGCNIVLGLDLPGTPGSTFVAYVDHGLGTVVKDAFPTPLPIAETLLLMDTTMRSDTTGAATFEITDLDLGEARALIEEALAGGGTLLADPTSETWPASEPVLDWLLSTMPEGKGSWADHGALDEYDEYDEDDEDFFEVLESRAGVARDFLGSDAATRAGLDLTGSGADDAALFLIFGSAPHLDEDDFLRWTPDRVEELLLGELPRTVLVDDVVAQRIPELLKAFAVWSLTEAGARKSDVAAIRKAVDECGSEYVELVTSQEARRLRQSIKDYAELLDDPAGIIPIIEAVEPDWEEFILDRLADEVGGRDQLVALDTAPLPDEDFDWSVVPGDLSDHIGEVVKAVDELGTARFGVEFRTACRRFLAEVVRGAPEAFRRRGTVASAAAVVVWLVGRANRVVGRGGEGMAAGELWAHFGVKGSSTRGHTFRKAVGVDPRSPTDSLHHAAWLTSTTRSYLVRQRDNALARQASRKG